MEGPTPISAFIHAASMVAAGIFLVARLLPLFQALPLVMGVISWTGAATALLGATIALAQRFIIKGLAYFTMSELAYIMLGSRYRFLQSWSISFNRTRLFQSFTISPIQIYHLFYGTIVGYSPGKSQNMAFMGGLRKHMRITRATFFIGTLSFCGIPFLACFWSKDEILAGSWMYF
jgi:NAD(P)H-quinone oxidoreductase subunit 5